MATFTPTTIAVPSAGTSILLTFTASGSLISPLLPASGLTGFTATVNGSAATISSATRSSALVITLALSSTVKAEDVVTVSYTGGNVTDSAGTPNTLATLTASAASNGSTQPGTFVPNSVAVNGSGSGVVVSFSGSARFTSPVLPASPTAVTGFSLKVNGTARTITSAVCTSTTAITLTPSSSILTGNTVTYSYTGSGNVTDSNSTPSTLAAATNASVTNNALTFVGNAATVSADGTTVTLTVSGNTGNLHNASNPATGFTVTVGGEPVLISSVTPVTTTLVLLLAQERVGKSSVATVAYDGTGAITDSSGSPKSLASFAAITATNGSNYVGTGREIVLATPQIFYSVDGTNFYEIGDYYPFRAISAYRTRYGGLNSNGTSSVDKSTTENTGQGDLPNVVVSDVVEYLWNKKISNATGNPAKFEIVLSGTTPVTFKFVCSDPDVDLYYTFNNRTPHANPSQSRYLDQNENQNGKADDEVQMSNPRSGGKYDDSHRPVLYQNTTGHGTVIKVRAFKQHASLEPASNTNLLSNIIKTEVKITGGDYNNTVG
jgi:uncharacterized repeat protein (TIGR02059 family)